MAALQRVLLAGGRAVLSGGEDAGGSVQGVQWQRWSGGHGPAHLDNLSDLALAPQILLLCSELCETHLELRTEKEVPAGGPGGQPCPRLQHVASPLLCLCPCPCCQAVSLDSCVAHALTPSTFLFTSSLPTRLPWALS